MSNLERIKAIKQAVFFSNEMHDEKLSTLIHPDAKINSPTNFENKAGSEGLREAVSYWINAFSYDKPAEWISIEDNGDSIIIHWEVNAIHDKAAFFDIDARNISISYNGKTTYQFRAGKLCDYRADVDIETIKNQLSPSINLRK